MRPRPLSIAVFALVVSCWCSGVVAAGEPFRFPEGKHQQGELKYVNGLPVLIVRGSPEEIGEQSAVLVGQSVAPLMDMPKEILRRQGMGAGWPVVAAMANVLLSRATEDHRRELEAVAKASEFDRGTIAVANTLAELRRLGGCSTLIVEPERSKTKAPLFGRNFDFPPMGVLQDYSLVVVCRPKGKRAFASVTFPGMIGVVSGMNDAGLAVATLDVMSSKDGSPMFDPMGTPLTFSFRRVLEECTTVAEAERLLRSVKPTTWMNLAVCDNRQGVVFEITPKNVMVRRPTDNILACTNHFRTRRLATMTYCERYRTLQKAWDRPTLGLGDVAERMHAVNQDEMTIQTMIFEPTGRKLHLAIGTGPVSRHPLKVLELDSLWKAKQPEAQAASRPR